MKRNDEVEITITVAVESEYTEAVPSPANDPNEPPEPAYVDLGSVCWIQNPGVDIRWLITQEQYEDIIDKVELAVQGEKR